MSSSSKLRTDAAKNRECLIEAAREQFSTGDRALSLEGVARAAGVGIGTLYRHFPTREVLVEAVYRVELDTLTAQAGSLLEAHAAAEALRMWMDQYTRFVAAKHAMYDALRIALASKASRVPETRLRIREAIAKFVAAGIADGTIRDDITADDITMNLAGIVLATTATVATDSLQMGRLLDLLMDGLRPRARG